ncbi:MAG: TAXI family TRAP transporter solute-binding subunit [Parvularculales bacterium]
MEKIVKRIRSIMRRWGWIVLVGLIAAAGGLYTWFTDPSPPVLVEPDVTFFTIATGSTAGTYFPVGRMIASVISQPPGAESCATGERCGVPNLIANAKTSPGSVANVRIVNSGQIDSALAQADVVYAAFTGERFFAGERPLNNLRVIANLYPEAMHLAVRKDAGITRIEDLHGKRVSLDLPGSGTRADAEIILKAYGLRLSRMDIISVNSSVASDMILRDELDAFFVVAGTPVPAITDLANRGAITLIPVEGTSVDRLTEDYRFLAPTVISAGTYKDIGDIKTLSVGALWVVNKNADEELIYNITRALFDSANKPALESDHDKGQSITLDNAVRGVPILLHPGALRFYVEMGVLYDG